MAPRQLGSSPPLMGAAGDQPAFRTASSPRHALPEVNDDFSWDEFDSSWYFEHNYKTLRDDDRQIIEVVRDFFGTLESPHQRRGIDVGSGTNLYPALAMLPLCEKITLYEHSASNVAWLQREIQSYSSSWDAFWDLLVKDPLYKSINSPREQLAVDVDVKKGSIFELHESQWDIGTMFFTAESISSDPAEFQTALTCFLKSLRPGAPFAVSFMKKSLGYRVGDLRFPAVAITSSEVESRLAGEAEAVKIYQIGLTNNPLRTGYGGMILATGKIARKN